MRIPVKRQWITSYLMIILMLALSSIFPRYSPLKKNVNERPNVRMPIKSLYMISYLTSVVTSIIFDVVFEINVNFRNIAESNFCPWISRSNSRCTTSPSTLLDGIFRYTSAKNSGSILNQFCSVHKRDIHARTNIHTSIWENCTFLPWQFI